MLMGLCLFAAAPVFAALPGADDSLARRRADLAFLLERLSPSRAPEEGRMNAHDKTWEDWVKRTGELPPDFAAMPSQAALPDPLVLNQAGTAVPITTMAQWAQQRKWMRAQFEHWVFGRMPPAPNNLRVRSSSERREGDVTVRQVEIEFGPDHRAKLHLELMIPDGAGPRPVFLTNHSRNNSSYFHTWVYPAVNRGYIACYYQATDPTFGAPDDSDAYIDVYPDYDFSCLARWAWAASRAVDYLHTCPEVDRARIGLAGHSRNGKQALVAAAFDERIGAVVASSGLQGEVLPQRYTSSPFVVESIQLITSGRPHWFHPRLRFFAGREHKLPVDQNMMLALVAPRGLMLYSGYSEYSSSSFGSEQAYRDVRRVYRFFDREQNVWLQLRAGDHDTQTADIENFMDFFDAVFGRRQLPKAETWIHGYDFDAWKAVSRQSIDPAQFPVRQPGDAFKVAGGGLVASPAEWVKVAGESRARLHWVMGEPPPVLPAQLARTLKENSPPKRNSLELVLGRPQADKPWQDRMAAVGMGMSSLRHGPGLMADVFYPLEAGAKRRGGKRPVVLWLHPYAHDAGWSAKAPWNPKQSVSPLDMRPNFDSLVRRGFIVVAFDQIGFGSRLLDARLFYERYPSWSLMGKMVADTRTVIDGVAALDEVDPSRIFLLGYSLGAKVGLITAALDARVRGIAAVCGLDPLRLDIPAKGTEGLRHYSHLHGLLPKLGFFLGHENRAPFDYDEVLALIAPRKVLVVAPEFDRYADVADVRREVAAARPIYRLLGGEQELELRTPHDFNRFPRPLQEEVFDYLAQAAR
jgi:dienelactone hydrolase